MPPRQYLLPALRAFFLVLSIVVFYTLGAKFVETILDIEWLFEHVGAHLAEEAFLKFIKQFGIDYLPLAVSISRSFAFVNFLIARRLPVFGLVNEDARCTALPRRDGGRSARSERDRLPSAGARRAPRRARARGAVWCTPGSGRL